MAKQSLAVKYRPKTWDDVSEQEEIKIILQQQLSNNEIVHGYLFCGPAGCGKTTAARIFANEINKGQGNPIELDAASNNSVEDIRRLIEQAQTQSLESEYKVFILDEVHMLSNSAWNAFLKTLEEPPAKSIFIMATTDPQKIPATILSRAQRYNFQRISQQGIVDRLKTIIAWEDTEILENGGPDGALADNCSNDAIEYIAKLANGGMRDAITLMDKCLSYSQQLTLENVVKALNTVDYATMFKLTEAVAISNKLQVIEVIENLYNSGKDLKQFVKQYVQFLLDVEKFYIGCDWKYINLPKLKEYEDWLTYNDEPQKISEILERVVKLDADIKYSSTPKYDVEVVLLGVCYGRTS